jgi:hypothetical protein
MRPKNRLKAQWKVSRYPAQLNRKLSADRVKKRAEWHLKILHHGRPFMIKQRRCKFQLLQPYFKSQKDAIPQIQKTQGALADSVEAELNR